MTPSRCPTQLSHPLADAIGNPFHGAADQHVRSHTTPVGHGRKAGVGHFDCPTDRESAGQSACPAVPPYGGCVGGTHTPTEERA